MAKILVDDTLFIGSDDLCKAFLEEMSKEFEMSMFGEINSLLDCKSNRRKIVSTLLNLNISRRY